MNENIVNEIYENEETEYTFKDKVKAGWKKAKPVVIAAAAIGAAVGTVLLVTKFKNVEPEALSFGDELTDLNEF